jgi:hypothetical protein
MLIDGYKVDGDITLIARDNEQDDTERSDADENWGLVERADVPGLKCGGTRAVRCGLTAGGALATCFFAGVAKGKGRAGYAIGHTFKY